MTAALAAQNPAPASQAYQPGQVIQVTAHHSRWAYPREITLPEGCQLHVVATGDTLWDLGNKYLGNPFSWPQIWEMNQWVTDPHWIYPGDHLVIPVGRAALKGETPGEVAGMQPGGQRFLGKPLREEYAYAFQDFLKTPYLVPNGAEAHFKEINAFKVASRKEPLSSQLGDLDTIYLDGGSDNGAKVGDRMLALKVVAPRLPYLPGEKRKGSMGDVIKQFAVVRLTEVDAKSSVAVIEKASDALEVGDHLVPFTEPANITLRLRTDVKSPIPIHDPAAQVIYVGEGHSLAGLSDMVIINRGTKDGYKVGDVLLSARERTWPVGAQPDATTGRTNYLIAQMLVVKAEDGSATCRILRGYEEVMVGDVASH
ncbi:MAG TPA: LysM peptidoglycan-binding domain-containing protein [Holophaga sp.]|nr:LysM peptidoglycan-binding domain-containing protein [Holophaga sp.]